MGRHHDKRFTGETDSYRASRDDLLDAEIALRRQVEKVAALRRSLPRGGKLKEDYVFDEAVREPPERTLINQTRFSQLFEDDKNSLVIYSYMFAPSAKAPCPMCTSFIDSLDRAALHARQRVNMAVAARAPIARLLEVARGRHWNNLRLLSSHNNSFNADYHSQESDDHQMPVLHVFERVGADVYHFYSTELVFVSPDPAQNQRHIDMIWPLWNLLDTVREGRGTDWFPRLSY